MSILDKAIAALSIIIVLGIINAEAVSMGALVVLGCSGVYKFAQAIADHGNL